MGLRKISSANIYILMGPANTGKSYVRHKYFKDCPYVDLWDFQENCNTEEEIMQSYKDAAHALQVMLSDMGLTTQTFVLEHTLLKSHRRPMYYEAIKKVVKNPNIRLIYMNPSADDLRARNKYSEDVIDRFKYVLDFMDIPTYDEDEAIDEIWECRGKESELFLIPKE